MGSRMLNYFRNLLDKKPSFASLSEQEILAIAIAEEEEGTKIYMHYARAVQDKYPKTAEMFEEMAKEEDRHRQKLIALYSARFGEQLPSKRVEEVRGVVKLKALNVTGLLSLDKIQQEMVEREQKAAQFYYAAAKKTTDVKTRKLLGDLALEEVHHVTNAKDLQEIYNKSSAKGQEEKAERRHKLLTIIQPGLAGLMDGSVSTLAPIFAAAFATKSPKETLLVGLSASLGAGISMGFTEAVHDDGKESGRGSPLIRGIACGVMTALGGLGHALPYLINDFKTATILAVIIVFIELWVIAWIQNKYMKIPFIRAAFQVVLGGFLVFLTGLFIGLA